MQPNQTDNPQLAYPPEECLAVRHMEPWVFPTYDGMIAACMSKKDKDGNPAKPTDDHEFWGDVSINLSNRNNRSDDTEFRAIKWLEREGWIINKNPGPQRHKADGTMAPVKYKVLHHVQYAAKYKDKCPPYRYHPITGVQLAAPSARLQKAIKTRTHRQAAQKAVDELFGTSGAPSRIGAERRKGKFLWQE